MDTTKLIEEAEREIAHMKAEALSAANPYTENTIRLTLIIDLAAALKASDERARKAEDEEEELRELVARYQEASGIDVGGDPGGVTPDVLSKFIQSEEARANAAEKQCAELAAANLAANKRIVELEQERDAAQRRAQENAEHALDIARDRDAARAELARLTTPRPIAEAPRDGTWVMGFWDETTRWDSGRYSRFLVVQWIDGEWRDEDYDELLAPSHYLPLPEVKP